MIPGDLYSYSLYWVLFSFSFSSGLFMASTSASTHSLRHLTVWLFMFRSSHYSVPRWPPCSSAGASICSCVCQQHRDVGAARSPWVRLKWWATSSQERCCWTQRTALHSQESWDVGRSHCNQYKENPSQPKWDSWHICNCWKSYTIWNKKAFLRPVGRRRRRLLPTRACHALCVQTFIF